MRQPMKMLDEVQTIKKQEGQRRTIRTPSRSLWLANKTNCIDMKTRPHICFVAPHAWPVLSGSREIRLVGGAEMQQSHIAKGLVAAGYQVSMLCLDFGQPARTEVDGVQVYRLHRPDAGLPVVRFFHPRLTSFWRGLHAVDADIYYQRGADMYTGVIAAFCRLRGKKAVFAGASNTDFHPDKLWIRYARDRWLYEYGLRTVDIIVAQNETQQQYCRDHYGREAKLIRSCYPAPIGAAADPSGGVLWVGTITEIKSPERFIELARTLPQYHFTMIGGPGGSDVESKRYYEDIRNAASRIPNLTFLGFVHPQDVEAYFDRARVFVNTSDTEGFPNTFLQAWARGIPTVSLFDPGSTHYGKPVCTLVSDIAGAANAVRGLMSDQEAWEAMGARCKAHFTKTHSLSRVLDSYTRLFETLSER